MYSCEEKDRRNHCYKVERGEEQISPASTRLVLPVILLGMSQHSVAEPADVSEGSVALVPQLLQPQHGTVPAVRERSLEKFENLEGKMEHVGPHIPATHSCESHPQANLLQNVLLPHEFLSFPAGFVDHDLQNILSTVGNVHHEED